MKKQGTIYLVGAGPGDPGLITLRGADLLRRADVVVYDALVNQELLHLAPRSAEIIFGGKRAREHSIPQDELNRLLLSKVREGKTVVRLKGGDPYIFGRGGEEAEFLADAGASFEVVPGVSSFVAVPNYAGVPLTHRDLSSRLTLVTGHGDPARETKAIDWAQLAATPGTKVVMMGTERIGEIAKTLIGHGMSPQTPIAMVRWGTTGKQESISATLATIEQEAENARIGPPTVAVIGEVVKLRGKLNWYEKKPLFGRRIVITRSREQTVGLSSKLTELGAEVLAVPVIRQEPPTRREDLIDALLELNSYDWLVFTSPTGVDQFFEYFFRQFKDMRDIGGARIAAVGPATAKRLRELHLQVDVEPAESRAAAISKAFAAFESIENLKICLLRAEVANPELPKALEELGAIVDDVPCYRTVAETEDRTDAGRRLEEKGADWILFTSGSTVQHFNSRFGIGALKQKFPGLHLASIGPETSKVLAGLGFKADLEAREFTTDGLVNALIEEAAGKRKNK